MTVDELAGAITAWLNARKIPFSMSREARALRLALPVAMPDLLRDDLDRHLLSLGVGEIHTEDEYRRWHVALKGA